MQQNDVAATQVLLAAGWQVRENIRRNLLGAAARIAAPVVGIDPIPHSDISHVLRDFQRAHLVGGVRLLVNGIGWTEQHGANPHQAGEKSFGQIQLHLHVSVGDIAYVRMREGVVPDDMAFVINALC